MRQRKRIGVALSDLKDWMVSYLVVLIIPIIICSMFFVYTYLVIWEETSNSNAVALQIVASELDDIFERTFNVEYAIQRDEKIQDCVQMTLPLDSEKRIRLLHAAKALGEYVGSESTILSTVYLIYPKSEMALTIGKVYLSLPECYELVGADSGYTYEEWSALVKQYNDRKFLKNDESISYIKSLPLYGSSVRMNVILELNNTYLQQILSKLDSIENSSVLLVDEENHMLISRNMASSNIEALSEDIEQTEGYHRMLIDGKSMMVSCVRLKHAKLNLISIIPYKGFWSTALKSLSLFWGILALCISIGVGVSYAISLKKHRTWGKMNAMAKKRLESRNNSVPNSRDIAKIVEEIVAEYDMMQGKLTSMESMKRELLISLALKGRIFAEEVESVLSKNNVDFKLGNFVVILFKLNSFEHFFDVGEKKTSEEEVCLIQQAVASMLQELNPNELPCTMINLDEKIVCILEFENSNQQEWLVPKQLDDLFTISISNVHEHVSSLQKAYGEALRVMEYQLNMGEKCVMSYLGMVDKMQMNYLYSLEEEKIFINWIYEGKEKEAIQFLEKIYERNISGEHGSEELNRCLVWNLTASVLRAENELKGRFFLPDTMYFLENVKKNYDSRAIKQLLIKRISEICKQVLEQPKVKGKKDILAEQVKAYIQEHYADANLSNNEISNYFAVNITYLSTIFKEKTGMNLLSYIHEVRLDKAKELLVTTELNIEEIGEKVGLSNRVSFIRLFKKYEGITPTEFRIKEKVGHYDGKTQ